MKKVITIITATAILTLAALAGLSQDGPAPDYTLSFNRTAMVTQKYKLDSVKRIVTTFKFWNGKPAVAEIISPFGNIDFEVNQEPEKITTDSISLTVYKGFFSFKSEEYPGAIFIQRDEYRVIAIYIVLMNKQYIYYNGDN